MDDREKNDESNSAQPPFVPVKKRPKPKAHSYYPIIIPHCIKNASSKAPCANRLAELIIVFTGGAGVVSVFDAGEFKGPVTLSENQCCLIADGVLRSVKIENYDRCVSLFIEQDAFPSGVWHDAKETVVADLGKLTWGDALMSQMIHEINSMNVICLSSPFVRLLLAAIGVKILEQFSRLNERPPSLAQKGLSEEERGKFDSFLNTNLAGEFSVVALAKHMGMSLTQLNRRFRASFGTSPKQYALKLCVDKALTLLRSKNMRVAEAAFAVGFCDQSHLDRQCRKFYGISPCALLRAPKK